MAATSTLTGRAERPATNVLRGNPYTSIRGRPLSPDHTGRHRARMTSVRHPIARLAALALGLLLAVALLPAAVAAVSGGLPAAEHRLDVSGDAAIAVTGLMPGDQGPLQTISLRATGALRYRIHVSYVGSRALAEALAVRLARPDGTVLYAGPLAGATVGGTGWPTQADPALADGESVTILVSVRLPLSAGNEIQGTSLQASIVVESFEDPVR